MWTDLVPLACFIYLQSQPPTGYTSFLQAVTVDDQRWSILSYYKFCLISTHNTGAAGVVQGHLHFGHRLVYKMHLC